jgi:hypothetical protein
MNKFKLYILRIAAIAILSFPLLSPGLVYADANYSNGTYGDCAYSSNCPTSPVTPPSSGSSTSKNSGNNATQSTPVTNQTSQIAFSVDKIDRYIVNSSNSSGIFKSNNTPTINGKAPANSTISITYHPVGYTCIIYSDINGNWSCTLDRPLSPGKYNVEISATTQSGKVFKSEFFKIEVSKVSKTINTQKNTNFSIYIIFAIIFFIVFIFMLKIIK